MSHILNLSKVGDYTKLNAKKPTSNDFIVLASDPIEGNIHHPLTANSIDQVIEVFKATYPDAIIDDIINN